MEPLSSEIKITGKVVGIYKNKTGRSVRLVYADNRGDQHYISAHCFNELEKKVDDEVSRFDILSLVGELRSYEKMVGEVKTTQYSVRASGFDVIRKGNSPI